MRHRKTEGSVPELLTNLVAILRAMPQSCTPTTILGGGNRTYTRPQSSAMRRRLLGFSPVRFPRFPAAASYLATWGHVVEAER